MTTLGRPSLGDKTPASAVSLALMYLLGFTAPVYAATLAYVTSELSDSVSVVDLDSRQQVGTISVGRAPVDVEVSCDGRRAFVANWASSSLSVIDTRTHQLSATWALGDRPERIALDATCGRAFVSLPTTNRIAVVDLQSGQVSSRIEAGTNPTAMLFRAKQRTLYVTDRSGNAMRLIDAEEQTIRSQIGLFDSSGPADIVTSESGSRFFLADLDSNVVTVFDPAKESVEKTIPTGNGPASIIEFPESDGRKILVASSRDDAVHLVDVHAAQVMQTIEVGHWPVMMRLAPSKRLAAVANFGESTISLIDIAHLGVTATIAVGPGPRGLAFVDAPAPPPQPTPTVPPSSTSDLALITTSESNLYLVDFRTRTTRELTSVRRRAGTFTARPDARVMYMIQGVRILALDPFADRIIDEVDVGSVAFVTLAPDGTRLYAVNVAPPQLVAIDTADLSVASRLTLDINVNDFALSPAGDRAYLLSRAVDRSILVVIDTARNTELGRIDLGAGHPLDLALSPDGQIAYLLFFERGLLVVDTKALAVLAEYSGVARAPSNLHLARDGLLALLSEEASLASLSLTRKMLSNRADLSQECAASYGTRLAWNSDSRRAYLVSNRGICVVDALTKKRVDTIPFTTGSNAVIRNVLLASRGDPCNGDCNGDAQVTVEEVVVAVSMALGILPLDRCSAVDADRGGSITVDEVVGAIGNALHGCN